MLDRWIAASTAYLSSAPARESLARDPYYPKWNSPWWHLTLLCELGRADAVPPEAAEAMFAAIAARYPRHFPNPREPLAAGKDPHRDSLCHCALGNMIVALTACGIDLDARAPWMRAWMLHYQLPDGGLNCDEKAYATGTASSVQSTLPALEAILCAPRPLTPAEEEFVDRAAGYLIERRLVCRRGDGRPMDPEFLKVGFPRFYDYDALRGLAATAAWSRVRRKSVPRAAVGPTLSALGARFPDGVVRVEKSGLAGERSLNPAPGGGWEGGPASTFPLLDAVRRVGEVSDALTRQWDFARRALATA